MEEGDTIETRQSKLVQNEYLPYWEKHRTNGVTHTVVLSHDNLFYYKGVLREIPPENLLFVRIRRKATEFVASFTDKEYDEHWFKLYPESHGAVIGVDPKEWKFLRRSEKAFWEHYEVEARWQQLKRDYPHIRTVELYWSTTDDSFRSMLDEFTASVGLSVAEKEDSSMVNMKRHITDSTKMDFVKTVCEFM